MNAPESAAVELLGITKTFPGVVANDHVDLRVRRGAVHLLVGENGAGKSTLMSILAGIVAPESGRIRVEGRDVRIASPRQARALGIGMVPQHAVLVPGLTILENLMLGESRGLRLPRRAARRHLQDLAGRLGVAIAPEAMPEALSPGQHQQVAIVKALWPGARVLILDEPTSLLTPQGIGGLQRVLVTLKGSGVAVILITHKVRDVLAIADTITILRGGRVVGTLDERTLRSREAPWLERTMVELMFGDEGRLRETAPPHGARTPTPRHAAVPSVPVLELIDASARGEQGAPGIHHLSLALQAREVLGIAGVDGNGQRVLAGALAGQRRLTGGEILVEGHPIGRLDVAARQRLGILSITDDRMGEGIVPALSVALNLVLTRIGQRPFWRGGRIQRGAIARHAMDLVRTFDIRTPGVAAPAGTLSGGNVQKVLLARNLSGAPRVVVYHKPTQGLDVRTTRWVWERIREQAAAGVAAIVISGDLDELLALCGRVAVLSRGHLVGTVETGAGAATHIGALMVGDATRQWEEA